MTEETMHDWFVLYGLVGIIAVALSIPHILLFTRYNSIKIFEFIVVTIVSSALLCIVSIIVGWIIVHGLIILDAVGNKVITSD